MIKKSDSPSTNLYFVRNSNKSSFCTRNKQFISQVFYGTVGGGGETKSNEKRDVILSDYWDDGYHFN